jgi:hypothetical protein
LSDAQYDPKVIGSNTANCKKVKVDMALDSVLPDSGCENVVVKYMGNFFGLNLIGIGPVTKFDQKMIPNVAKLHYYLKYDYDNGGDSKTVKSPDARALRGADDSARRLGSDISLLKEWNPEDGISQIFWKGVKQYQSRYLKNDIYEMPLYVIGDDSSSLNGFDIKDYDMFKRKGSVCLMASDYGARLSNAVNLRKNDNKKFCKPTNSSCCEEEWYQQTSNDWDRDAKIGLKSIDIMRKLIDQFDRFINKLDAKTNVNILRREVFALRDSPGCDEYCQVKVDSFDILRIINQKGEILYGAYNNMTKCANYLSEASRSFRCSVCDLDKTGMYFTDPKTGAKHVKVDGDACHAIFDNCFDSYESMFYTLNGMLAP